MIDGAKLEIKRINHDIGSGGSGVLCSLVESNIVYFNLMS